MISNLDIIKSSNEFIFINKPAGVHSVSLSSGGGASIADLIKSINPEATSYADKSEDSGLINRLDFDTSGILIGARSRQAWCLGRRLIKEEQVKKEYLVVLEGRFPEAEFVENYLGSPNRGASKVKVYRSKPAKSARALLCQTEFFLLKYHPALNLSLVRVGCPRAQRHQIRVHSAHLGYPLLGDSLYGARRSYLDVVGDSSRKFCLHAERVVIDDAVLAEKVDVRAPLLGAVGKIFQELAAVAPRDSNKI